jgi:uncharacterized protein with FMN-binding domain
MSSHSTTSRSLAVAFAGLGLVGALAGCASPAATTDTGTGTDTGTSDAPSTDTGSGSTTTYKDGDYKADGSYQAPSGTETVTVQLTLSSDKVTALKVIGHATAGTQATYQAKFVSGIKDQVVGKDLDTLAVSRVAGSSLTSGGFNSAIKDIQGQAAS